MSFVKIMLFSKIIILFAAFLLFVDISNAQQPTDNPEIYAEGFDAGNKIREQVFKFTLDSTQKEHTAYVRDVGLNYYKLILQNFPPNEKFFKYEYWAVQLKPVLSEPNQKEELGCNRLLGGCGDGYIFSKEDNASILFPTEAVTDAIDKIKFRGFHPLMTKRVIKVRNFYLTIQVDSYKMSEIEPKRLDSMEVTVELINEYKSKKNCK